MFPSLFFLDDKMKKNLRLTFLGTGTSTGVPQIGCDCEVCRSIDPRDSRLRSSVLIERIGGERLLIDCGPDFRAQMLSLPFRRLDAVLITHEHYDHVSGLDDLRPFCRWGEIPIYGEKDCLQDIHDRIPYCFVEHPYPGVPGLQLRPITAGVPFSVGSLSVLPVRVWHGALPIVGFRIGPLAYITDMKTIDADDLRQLKGVRVLVVNGLRHTSHGSHQTIAEACDMAASVGAEQAYITHLCHHAGRHDTLVAQLPEGVQPAYDGLVIDV